jgi:hypothetical protein
MKEQEIHEKALEGDPRVFYAIQDARKTDKSFTEKENFFTVLRGGLSYSQTEVREIWFTAMALGMHEGLRMGSMQGQRIDLTNSCKNSRQKEFLEKFYKLADEYNCAINYHPLEGMQIVDLNRH